MAGTFGNLDTVARTIFSAVDRTAKPVKSATRNLRWFSTETQKALKQASQITMRVGAAIGTAMAGIAGATISARNETEDALGGVASMGIKDLGALEDAARDFSNNFSKVTRVGFLDAAYDIKSGIGDLSDSGVADMTRLAALTGVATKATTEQMTELFAQGYNIYGKLFKTPEEFGQAFSGGLSEAVKRFRTDGKEMAGGIANIQGVATSMGVSMSEQFAVLGLARNTYKSGEEAGTAYAGIMLKLGAAGKKLGTSFVDSSGKALGMVKILRKLEHAQKSAISKGRGADFQLALKEAFGEDAQKFLSAMMGKSKDLAGHIDGITSATKKGEAATLVMANAMEQGGGRASARFGNQLSNLADTVGSILSPSFQGLMEPLADILVDLQAWIRENPGLVQGIGIAAGVISGLAAALAVATFAVWAWNASMVTTARNIVGTLFGAVKGIIALVWKFTVALLSNPFVLIAVGIIAVLVAIYYFRDELLGVWEWIKSVASNVWDSIVGVVSGAWDGMISGLGELWEWIKAGVAQLFDWLPPDLLISTGMDLINGLWEGIKSIWATLKGWFWGAVNGLLGVLPDFIKRKMGIKVDGQVSTTATQAKTTPTSTPAQILRQAQDARVRTESSTRIQLDLRNAPGLAVSQVDKSGADDVDVALAGANFSPAM